MPKKQQRLAPPQPLAAQQQSGSQRSSSSASSSTSSAGSVLQAGASSDAGNNAAAASKHSDRAWKSGGRLARRARSFKQELVGRIHQLRSPANARHHHHPHQHQLASGQSALLLPSSTPPLPLPFEPSSSMALSSGALSSSLDASSAVADSDDTISWLATRGCADLSPAAEKHQQQQQHNHHHHGNNHHHSQQQQQHQNHHHHHHHNPFHYHGHHRRSNSSHSGAHRRADSADEAAGGGGGGNGDDGCGTEGGGTRSAAQKDAASIRRDMRDVRNACGYFKDCVTKGILDMVPGSASVVLETVIHLLTLLRKKNLPNEDSSALRTRAARVHASLADLLEWADGVMLRREEPLLAPAQRIVDALLAALDALVEHYGRAGTGGAATTPPPPPPTLPLSGPAVPAAVPVAAPACGAPVAVIAAAAPASAAANGLSHSRSECANISVNSLPDIHLSPREHEILLSTPVAPHGMSSSTDDILSPPPPKPPLPFASLDSIDAPPLPPKKRTTGPSSCCSPAVTTAAGSGKRGGGFGTPAVAGGPATSSVRTFLEAPSFSSSFGDWLSPLSSPLSQSRASSVDCIDRSEDDLLWSSSGSGLMLPFDAFADFGTPSSGASTATTAGGGQTTMLKKTTTTMTTVITSTTSTSCSSSTVKMCRSDSIEHLISHELDEQATTFETVVTTRFENGEQQHRHTANSIATYSRSDQLGDVPPALPAKQRRPPLPPPPTAAAAGLATAESGAAAKGFPRVHSQYDNVHYGTSCASIADDIAGKLQRQLQLHRSTLDEVPPPLPPKRRTIEAYMQTFGPILLPSDAAGRLSSNSNAVLLLPPGKQIVSSVERTHTQWEDRSPPWPPPPPPAVGASVAEDGVGDDEMDVALQPLPPALPPKRRQDQRPAGTSSPLPGHAESISNGSPSTVGALAAAAGSLAPAVEQLAQVPAALSASQPAMNGRRVALTDAGVTGPRGDTSSIEEIFPDNCDEADFTKSPSIILPKAAPTTLVEKRDPSTKPSAYAEHNYTGLPVLPTASPTAAATVTAAGAALANSAVNAPSLIVTIDQRQPSIIESCAPTVAAAAAVAATNGNTSNAITSMSLSTNGSTCVYVSSDSGAGDVQDESGLQTETSVSQAITERSIDSGGAAGDNAADLMTLGSAGVDILECIEVEPFLVFSETSDDVLRGLKGGPADALLVYATKTTEDKGRDFVVQETFLTTYRSFVPAQTLVDKLVSRYNCLNRLAGQVGSGDPSAAVRLKYARNSFSLLVRVVDDLCLSDATDELLLTLSRFTHTLLQRGDLSLARALRQKVVEKYTSRQRAAESVVLYANLRSVSLSRGNTLLSFKSDALAQQMTLLDNELFQKIDIPEVLIWAKQQNEERSPNLTRFTEHFNNMSYWARSCVLQQTDQRERERCVIKFLKMMKALRRLNNFNSYLALLSALDSAPLRRLDWQRAIVEGLREFSVLIDSSSSFRAYRQAVAETQPPCIPYIGLILQDLTFVHVGNTDYIDHNGTQIINFFKCWQQYNILEPMRKFKKKPYSIRRNDEIIDFFNNFEDYLSEEAMWQISETIKPRGKK